MPRSGPLWPLTCGVQDAFLLSLSSSPPDSGSVSLAPRASVMRCAADALVVPDSVLAAEVPLVLGCLAVAHPNHTATGIVMLLAFTVD